MTLYTTQMLFIIHQPFSRPFFVFSSQDFAHLKVTYFLIGLSIQFGQYASRYSIESLETKTLYVLNPLPHNPEF